LSSVCVMKSVGLGRIQDHVCVGWGAALVFPRGTLVGGACAVTGFVHGYGSMKKALGRALAWWCV